MAAGLLTCSVVFGQGGVQPAQRRDPPKIFREWVAAVESHRPGARDEAAARVAAWSEADLETSLRLFSGLTSRNDHNLLAVRAATLHADVGMWQWDAVQGVVTPPPSAALPAHNANSLIAIDGRLLGPITGGAHWVFARRVVDRIRPSPSADALARLWYQATAAYLIGSTSITEAIPHVARARQIYRDDAFFAFSAGCIAETRASPRIQEAVRTMTSNARFAVESPATQLREAETAFRRAVALDPAFAEAHLRLGRVLALRGDTREAVKSLETALARAGADADDLRYLAWLFLGERREAAREFDAARAAYDRAARLFPRAQSALLAIGQLARRNGDRASAQQAAARLVELSAGRQEADDPWWYYDRGPGARTEELLADLHAALTRGPG